MASSASGRVDEARRILYAADARSVPLRAVGSIGVALRAPSVRLFRHGRSYTGIELAAVTSVGPLETLLDALGYAPARPVDGLREAEPLRFDDATGRRLDVHLGVLRMCHDLPFGDRLVVDALTLPLADLLLAKLQIVDPSADDAHDVAALLADHELTDDDAGIGLRRVAAMCANDWGWWKTVDGNLSTLIDRWRREAVSASADQSLVLGTAVARASGLRDRIAATPKSTTWRLRAVVGERVRWYEARDGSA